MDLREHNCFHWSNSTNQRQSRKIMLNVMQVEISLKQSFSNLSAYLWWEREKIEKKTSVLEENVQSFLKKIEESYKLLLRILPEAVYTPLSSISIDSNMSRLYTALKYNEFALFESFLNVFQQIMLSLIAIISTQKVNDQQQTLISEVETILGQLAHEIGMYKDSSEEYVHQHNKKLNIYCACNMFLCDECIIDHKTHKQVDGNEIGKSLCKYLDGFKEDLQLREWKINRDLATIEKSQGKLLQERFRITLRATALKDLVSKQEIDPIKFNMFRKDGKNPFLDYSGVQPRIKLIYHETMW